MKEIPLLSNPSTNSMQLRLIVLSWIVNDNITATHLVPNTNMKQISSHKDIPKCNGENIKVIKLMLASTTLRLPWNMLSNSDDDFMPLIIQEPPIKLY